MQVVTLYSAHGCHLCDEALAVLELVRQEIPFALERIAIDGDPLLEALYRAEIPVVLVDGAKRFKYRVDAARLRRLLRASRI
jgi:hypothetical protein